MRQLDDVYGHELLFWSNHHPPLTLNLQKNLLIFYLFIKRWSWSSCLSHTSFFKSLFTLFMFLFFLSSCVWVFICSFSQLHYCYSYPYYFFTLVFLMLSKLVFLQLFHILATFLSLRSWALQACVLVVLFGHVLVIFLDYILVAPSSHSYCSKLATRIIIAPSSCSCCSSWSCFCCFKLVFLLLQACILIVLFSHVFVAPRSHSCYYYQSCCCCSKLTFKCCYSQLCFCCSKLTFECCSSWSHSSTLNLHSY